MQLLLSRKLLARRRLMLTFRLLWSVSERQEGYYFILLCLIELQSKASTKEGRLLRMHTKD